MRVDEIEGTDLTVQADQCDGQTGSLFISIQIPKAEFWILKFENVIEPLIIPISFISSTL